MIREFSHRVRDWLRKIRKRHRDRISAAKAALLRRPAGILFDFMRCAHSGKRTTILGYALPSLLSIAPLAPEPCEIKSLAGFQRGYAQLAAMLGRPGAMPAPDEFEFLNSLRHRKVNYPGTIGPPDYLFLTACISILAPRRVVEVGTLTGFSTAIIAAAVSRRHGKGGAAWIDSIDTRNACAIDESRPTGFEIADSFPEFAPIAHVHTPRDSTFVAQLAAHNQLELAFIDADHRHPAPLLDLLRLMPYIGPERWVLLHDIQLGTMSEQRNVPWRKPAFECAYGAEWLFNRWPHRKISGGNIGAIQLPPEKATLIAFAIQMMAIPFETAQKNSPSMRRALYESIEQLC